MKPLKLLLLFIIPSVIIFAQNISVIDTEEIEINDIVNPSFPKFLGDDDKIIFTNENYSGLYEIDLISNEVNQISAKNGAGYNPLIIEDEIIFRTFDISDGKKYHSLHSYKTGTITTISDNKRRIRIPNQNRSSSVKYIEDSQILDFSLSNSLSKNTLSRSVFVEDNNLILVEDNETKIINPFGKGVYVWESISEDGEFLLFTFKNQGAFVSTIDGEIVLNIPEAHYPRFSPDGNFISYMIDKDDGHQYLSSDIFIYSIESGKSFSITNSDNRIEMYPEWSADGNKLVYHSLDGKIFIAHLNFEN